MNIYIYSDESGVFDNQHNEYFVFGGLIILGNEEKEIWSRKYSHVENTLRKSKNAPKNFELKATHISNKEKDKLFRSLNNCYKFGVIINQQSVLKQIFKSKKDKQRYLDYAYKIGVKRALENIIQSELINPDEIKNIYFYVDEHTTATNGKYELEQALEQEFKFGTYNYNYCKYFPPIFPSMNSVNVTFCDSSSKLLVRAADIIANKIYYYTVNNEISNLDNISNLHIIVLP